MEHPNSYLEALGIDRTDKWVEEASEEVGEFLTKNYGVFGLMSTQYLVENNPEALPLLLIFPSLGKGVIALNKLFYHVGYLKGMSVVEDRAGRDQ